jgi:hypothetical protein
MAQEIVIRGKVYVVTRKGDKENNYVLSGVRGARYRTIRNVPNPHMMFIVSERKFLSPASMNGVWLTDKGGTLKVSEQ